MLVAEEKRFIKKIKNSYKQIYINTLTPNFNYFNEKGELVFKNNYCINL